MQKDLQCGKLFCPIQKSGLPPLVKEAALQSASRDSCEGFFVDQQQEELLKQAEPVTSPLCPERRIMVDSD